MSRAQQHLAEIAATLPTPDGTEEILRVITAAIEANEADEKARRTKQRGSPLKLNPYVTDAGKCPRAVVYSLQNVAESDPPNIDSKLRFLLGHSYEDAVAGLLAKHQGATFLREERVEIPYDVDGAKGKITGRRDFDAVRLQSGESIIELKSTNARAMGFKLRRGPDDTHVRQTNLYLHATGKNLAYLVYLVAGPTKGEPVLHSWTVKYDKEQAESDVMQLIELAVRADCGETIDIPEGYKQSTFPCSYCNYKKVCWQQKPTQQIATEESQ